MLAATKYFSRKANIAAVGVACMRLGIMLYFTANTLLYLYLCTLWSYVVYFYFFAIQYFNLFLSFLTVTLGQQLATKTS